MTSITTYIRPDQLAALRALSERTRVPMAVLIRQALDAAEVVREYGRSWQAVGVRR